MSTTPYNPAQYAPYPAGIPENAEFTSTASLANSIGDLAYFDSGSNTLKPVSQILDQGSAVLTQALAVSKFAGLFNSQQLATDATARMARLLVDLVVEFSVVSGTFNPGDYLTFVYTTTGAGNPGCLADQQLTKTTNPAIAIARVVRQYTAATTLVKCRLTSRLYAGFMADSNQAQPTPFAAAQALATGNTITVPAPPQAPGRNVVVTTTGAVTGAIMPAGTYDGQEVLIVNDSANSVTFAAAGTSLVADGTGGVIAANTRMHLIWNAALSLWFHGN